MSMTFLKKHSMPSSVSWIERPASERRHHGKQRLIRMLCAMLVLALLCAAAEADTEDGRRADLQEYLTHINFIYQYDEEWQHTAYLYSGDKFKRTGCAPSSVTNALEIAFDVEDDATTRKLLKDVLQLLSGNRKPSESVIDLDYFVNMQARAGKAEWDKLYVRRTMTELLAEFGGDILFDTEKFTADEALSAMRAATPTMLLARVSLYEEWSWLANVVETLCDAGYENAVFIFCNVGTGPVRYSGPFCLGEDGHYVTLCLQAGEFRDSGTLYMIDSVPRAVRRGEEGFASAYYFASGTAASKRDCADFLQNFTAEHLTRSVVKLAMTDTARAQILEMRMDKNLSDQARRSAVVAVTDETMSAMRIFGQGMCILKLMEPSPDQ